MKICITNSTDHKYILSKIKLYKVALEYRQSFVQNSYFMCCVFINRECSVNARVMVRSVYKLKQYFLFHIKAIVGLNSDISKDKTLKKLVKWTVETLK